MALKYGGKTISDYSAMRGPCPEGFHVPMIKEWRDLIGALAIVLSTDPNGAAMKTYLKMPLAGFRNFPGGGEDSKGSFGNYWTSTRRLSVSIWCIIFGESSATINLQNYSSSRTYGYSIRGFKDSPVIPDNSWVVLYDGGSIATGAGVFHNATLGLISVSGDGVIWYTITDKNLGATTVYNDGDTLSEANCGKFYQRGNNYGFPWTGTMTMSSTKVDASGYGPGNYYSSDTFITGYGDWSSVRNDNLRGGVTGVKQNPVDIVERYYGGKLIDDYSAMRGPCPEGFHVPSDGERTGVKDIMDGFSLTIGPQRGVNLKMPLAGEREYLNGTPSVRGVDGYYWSSCCSGTNAGRLRLNISSNRPTDILYHARTSGYSIRPFKDSYVEPTSSRTVIQGALGSAGIFWNQSEGLISITNGSIEYTMMDKNLGATQVYTDGATLSEANCGKFYQRGNNYGFSRTGTIPTSSTPVDASSYGPGNYYNSSTFITGDSYWDYDWSNPANDNLWGCVTGVQQRPAKVTEVYYGSTKIRPLSFNN